MGVFIYGGGHFCPPRKIDLRRRSKNNCLRKQIYASKNQAIFKDGPLKRPAWKNILRPTKNPYPIHQPGLYINGTQGFTSLSLSLTHPTLSLSPVSYGRTVRNNTLIEVLVFHQTLSTPKASYSGHTPRENPKDPHFFHGSNNKNELQYLSISYIRVS